MTTDWEKLIEGEPWLVPSEGVTVVGPTSSPGVWTPQSQEFESSYPKLTRLLRAARTTPLSISEDPWVLYSWGGREQLCGWVSPVNPESIPPAICREHSMLVRSFGGVTERFGEPESTWLLNHVEALTTNLAKADASFIEGYYWPPECPSIPIEVDEYYCIAQEANGNCTLCHRVDGSILMFAHDHCFSHIVPFDGCPEYTLYRIPEALTLNQWVEVVAAQWLEHAVSA